MDVFKNLPVDNDYEVLKAAVAAILARAKQLHVASAAWSLAELCLDHDDFTWLCAWARQLKYGVTRRCLREGQWQRFQIEHETYSYTECMGLLLLLTACEVARREADERGLWGAIRKSFSLDAQDVLFTQGTPTRYHRDALELAARRFGLRHVFGIEGLQNWYDTISLQFGFSRHGFLRRLPEWLAKQGQPFAVQRLLNGPMQSKSFKMLWDTLHHFRQKNITEGQCQKRLHDNPWILPEWIDDLLRVARTKPHLESKAGTPSGDISTDEQAEPFLDEPVLHWEPPSAPHFTCQIANLATLDLTEEHYEIVIAGKSYARLARQSDGTYSAEPSETITLPVTRPSLAANLLAEDGSVIQSLTLRLWDENEDVIAYKAMLGQRIDPWQAIMRPGEKYILQIASDLTVIPPPQHWYQIGRTKLYWLEAGWSPQLQVQLEGEALWYPRLNRAMTPLTEIAARVAPDIKILITNERMLHFGEQTRFSIVHPADTSISFVRIGGQPIDFEVISDRHVTTAPLEIQPALFASQTEAKVELSIGVKTTTGIVRILKDVVLPCMGVAQLTPDGWKAIDPTRPLTVEQAQTQPTKLFLYERGQWMLFEGDLWIDRNWQRPRPIGTLTGLGAALTLRKGTYNVLEEPFIVTQTVTNPACIADIEIIEDPSTSQDRTLRVHLTHSIEPDNDHALLWWDSKGIFQVLSSLSAEYQEGEIWWQTSLPSHLTQPLAVAIAYKGARLGAWWDIRWSRILHTPKITAPSLVAAMLRWLQLPLLGANYSNDVKTFITAYPVEIFSAWIADQAPRRPFQIQWTETGIIDGWLSTVRALTQDWQPEAGTAQALVDALIDDEVEDALFEEQMLQVVWHLLRVSPLLMGTVILAWVKEVGLPQLGKKQTQSLLDLFIKSMLNVEEDASQALISQNEKELKQGVALEMHVDPNFLERSVIPQALNALQRRSIEPLHLNNINVACNNEQFRRFLGLRVLRLISQMVGGGR